MRSKRKTSKSNAEQEVIISTNGEQDEQQEEVQTEENNDANELKTQFYEDSSEDEWDDPTKNTVGNIPMHFYDEYLHIGYNIRGEKILRPEGGKDELDKYIAMEDDPNFWRTVHDNVTGKDVVLSDEDYKLVKSILQRKFPDSETFDPYMEYPEFEWPDADFPVTSAPARKSSFTPSKWEMLKVRRIIRALKNGWITMKPSLEEQLEQKRESELRPKYYLLWEGDATDANRKNYLPPPQQRLPDHNESYHPPAEYLFNEDEKKQWEEQEPPERKLDFMPQSFDRMRNIPGYEPFIKERFERCIDLFLCPRVPYKKPKDELSEQLLPELPPVKDLKPFPTMQSIVYTGHTGKVRSISVDPTGQWLASGSDDNSIRIWEVDTGRCIKLFSTDSVVNCVQWNPNPDKPFIAATSGNDVLVLNPETGTRDQIEQLNQLFLIDKEPSEQVEVVTWNILEHKSSPPSLKISHKSTVKKLAWHGKGDYLVAVCPDANVSAMLVVHQISAKKSQNPFVKQKGKIQAARFHPLKPMLFIATQNHVKLYNLAELKLEKRLSSTCKYISSIDVHPTGDHVLMGGYDCKLAWFDLDLSEKPYKNLRYHKEAIRAVAYHKRYPLFASCSDDLKLHVFHGMVYSDLLKNALLVPLKQLKGHKLTDDLGILDCVFHPIQPWLFSAGADTTIRLYV